MSVQEVVGLAVEGGAPEGRGGVGPAFRGVGVALEGPSKSRALSLPLPERLVYEVRQKCRNIEGES